MSIMKMVPRFADCVPVSAADLQLYFRRRVPQMLSYLTETERAGGSTDLMEFLGEVRVKIAGSIISGVKNRKL